MLRTTLATAAAVTLVAATAGTAAAQYAPVPYTVKPHDHAGFYARVFFGPAGFSSTADDNGNEVTISGSGGAFGVAAGYSVTPNIVVFGELFDDVAIGPDLEVNGQSQGSADDDVAAGVVGFGVGVGYWFMPINAYVSGTLAMSQLTVQENGQEVADTDTGPGISLMAGKEWWIGQDVGIGGALQVFVGSQPERDSDVRWRTTAVSLALTLSYN